jgi:hypothetical protein
VNEKGFWERRVKPALHNPDQGRVAKKVQDAYNGGLPDVACCVGGAAYWLELKYLPKRPVRATTMLHIKCTEVQRKWLTDWRAAGGMAWILLGVEEDWWLLSPDVPDDIFEHDLDHYMTVHGTGKAGLQKLPSTIERMHKRLIHRQVEEERKDG